MTTAEKQADDSAMLFTKAIIAGSASSSFAFVKLCLSFIPTFITVPNESIAWLNSILDQLQPYAQSITFCWLIMSWFSLVRNMDNVDSSSTDEKKNESKGRKTRSQKFLLLMSATLICLSLIFMPESLRIVNNPQISSANDNSKIIKLGYNVDNMDCGGCIRSVEAILSKQTGVISAKVLSLDSGETEVYLNKELIDNYEKKEFDNVLNNALMLEGYELQERSNDSSKIIKVDYIVDNMDCGGCIRSVEAILSKQIGVISAKVLSLDSGETEVHLNKELIDNYEKKEFDNVLNNALMLKGYELHEH